MDCGRSRHLEFMLVRIFENNSLPPLVRSPEGVWAWDRSGFRLLGSTSPRRSGPVSKGDTPLVLVTFFIIPLLPGYTSSAGQLRRPLQEPLRHQYWRAIHQQCSPTTLKRCPGRVPPASPSSCPLPASLWLPHPPTGPPTPPSTPPRRRNLPPQPPAGIATWSPEGRFSSLVSDKPEQIASKDVFFTTQDLQTQKPLIMTFNS